MSYFDVQRKCLDWLKRNINDNNDADDDDDDGVVMTMMMVMVVVVMMMMMTKTIMVPINYDLTDPTV